MIPLHVFFRDSVNITTAVIVKKLNDILESVSEFMIHINGIEI